MTPPGVYDASRLQQAARRLAPALTTPPGSGGTMLAEVVSIGSGGEVTVTMLGALVTAMQVDTVNLAPGDTVLVTDVTGQWVVTGRIGAPRTPWLEVRGVVNVSLSAAATGSSAVNLSGYGFTVVPRVHVDIQGAPAGSGRLVARAQGITAAGFNASVNTGDGSTTTSTVSVVWFAIQVGAGAADG